MSKMLHTCVRVENLEESIRFYEEAFGFKETRRKTSQNINSQSLISLLKEMTMN